ncbi:MAG TPA: hypothetical protein DCP02_06205 [Actinobacteria bacterium]|nr:hypothetical protein [Actinomycetota bacterium]
MNRISLILKNKISAVLFIAAAVIGAILIIWYLKTVDQKDVSGGALEQEPVIEDEQQGAEEIIGDHKVPLDGLSSQIPSGMKAVNLPISFFGNCLILKIGDRIDIISTYYDKESAVLHAEMILSGKEIISLETGQGTDKDNYGSISGNIFPEVSFGADVNNGISRTLVITFFLEDEEIVRSFTAIESGMLYLSLCPENDININY